jgi:hypothetical protein
VRTPLPSAVHEVQPVSTSPSASGTVAGAPRMPISEPMVWSWIVCSGTTTGCADEPMISRAEVMLTTGLSTGWLLARVMT